MSGVLHEKVAFKLGMEKTWGEVIPNTTSGRHGGRIGEQRRKTFLSKMCGWIAEEGPGFWWEEGWSMGERRKWSHEGMLELDYERGQ